MLSFIESGFICALIVAASLAFLLILDWIWPRTSRREHNDIIGWQVTVVGTIYAVIIGFMLITVWTDFQAAQTNTDAEANALVNIGRLAGGLPQQQRDAIQATAMRYAVSMVTDEWPAMARGEISPKSQLLTARLWSEIIQQGSTPDLQDRVILDHAFTELAVLTTHRRVRQLESETSLPGILWAVLVSGAIITIASCCLFGAKSRTLHLLQVLALSTLVALSLMAIAQIDRPFQGGVHVEPHAFLRAQEALRAAAP